MQLGLLEAGSKGHFCSSAAKRKWYLSLCRRESVPILREAGDNVAQFQKVSKPFLVAFTRSMSGYFQAFCFPRLGVSYTNAARSFSDQSRTP
jgi:hypothetical protein